MMKKLLLISTVIIFGCKDQGAENVIVDPAPPPSEIKEVLNLPNPEDCTGISIIWSAGETDQIFTLPNVIKQIPKSYEGRIKLIGLKCKDCENQVDGLYRYVSVKNRKLNGVCYEYSPKGSYSEQFFKDGLKQGTWISYFVNGTVSSYQNYRNGLLHGKYEFFYETGSTWVKGCYSNGEYIGEQLEYYSNGKLKELKKYDLNGLTLLIENFREDGTLMSKMTFRPLDVIFYDLNGNEIPKPLNVREKIEVNRN